MVRRDCHQVITFHPQDTRVYEFRDRKFHFSRTLFDALKIVSVGEAQLIL